MKRKMRTTPISFTINLECKLFFETRHNTIHLFIRIFGTSLAVCISVKESFGWGWKGRPSHPRSGCLKLSGWRGSLALACPDFYDKSHHSSPIQSRSDPKTPLPAPRPPPHFVLEKVRCPWLAYLDTKPDTQSKFRKDKGLLWWDKCFLFRRHFQFHSLCFSVPCFGEVASSWQTEPKI